VAKNPHRIVCVAAGAALAALAVACGSSSSSSPTSPTDNSFRVVSAQATVDSASFTGACPHKFTFTGTITVNTPGTATYRWERSDSTYEAMQTLTFATAGSQTQTNTWDVGASSGGWMRLHILGPNDLLSNQATFSLTCTPAFTVTAVSVAVDPATFSGTCPHGFIFTASITAKAAGTATYRWERSDQTTGQAQSVTFTGTGISTQQVTDQWDVATSGTAWERLRVTVPNELLSNQVPITVTCR
jgi:hypothetical protein